MKVEFKQSFARDLRKVKNKTILKRVQEVVEQVERANTPAEVQNLKKLRGSESRYRIRVGDFRVGLLIEQDTVTFVRFLHRKDIYRYFPLWSSRPLTILREASSPV